MRVYYKPIINYYLKHLYLFYYCFLLKYYYFLVIEYVVRIKALEMYMICFCCSSDQTQARIKSFKKCKFHQIT